MIYIKFLKNVNEYKANQIIALDDVEFFENVVKPSYVDSKYAIIVNEDGSLFVPKKRASRKPKEEQPEVVAVEVTEDATVEDSSEPVHGQD